MKEGDFTRPPFAVIFMYVRRCEECGNSVFNIAANLDVQTLGCTVKPIINLTVFFSCLSELWERACTLDKHISMLLVLIQEKTY